MLNKEKETKLRIDCCCGDPYHIVSFDYLDDERSLYITTMTLEPSLWRRIKEAVEYILGKKIIWSEAIIGLEEIGRLEKFVSKLK